MSAAGPAGGPTVAAADAPTMTEERARRTGVRQLGSIVGPWRWLLLLVAALIVTSALLEIVPPLLIRQAIDEHLTVGRADGLLTLAFLYLGATAAIQFTSALAAYLTSVAAQGALHGLRVRLFDHLQWLPISFYDRTPLGDVISRCTADVETLDVLFSSGVAKVVADLARLVTVGSTMVALSPLLASVSLLVAPPLAIVTRLLQIRIRAAERANRQAIGLLNTHLQETLGGVEVIRAFDREETFVAQFRLTLRETLSAFNRATMYAALYPPTTAILAALATALLLWTGTGGIFAAWDVSAGTLAAFVLLFDRFFRPIRALGDDWQTVQSALSGAERIFEVLGMPIEEPRAPAAGIIPAAVLASAAQGGSAMRDGSPAHGPGGRADGDAALTSGSDARTSAVALDRITFGYLPGRPVLHRVSLTVGCGEHVALVGRTGAGKSSALHLVGGLYAPWDGAVRVAGHDPQAIPPDERRRLVGIVSQVVQLFGGSVLDNLTLYDPGVPRERIERAARVAGADAFIRALPDGYDTLLSGGHGAGIQLSSGQRQLLALARALVWDPPVLLLDEATAAIDSASDTQFRAALRADTGRGRAVLTIAHRLSTAREADRVIVLEAGRVVEAGPPTELERRGGRFAALVQLEAAGWEWQTDVTGPSASRVVSHVSTGPPKDRAR